jgi:hypothetical protein
VVEVELVGAIGIYVRVLHSNKRMVGLETSFKSICVESYDANVVLTSIIS